MQEDNNRSLFDKLSEDNIGLILQELEELENFYPCFKSMIQEE